MKMKLLLKAFAGGVLIPLIYFGIWASAGTIVEWTHGEEHPSLELLIMPLVWPMNVIDRLYSYLYGENVFVESPVTVILLTIVMDFVAYALLSYGFIWWRERRRRLP
jgi:hypothetical protein